MRPETNLTLSPEMDLNRAASTDSATEANFKYRDTVGYTPIRGGCHICMALSFESPYADFLFFDFVEALIACHPCLDRCASCLLALDGLTNSRP